MLKKCDEQQTANSEQTDSTVYRVAAQLINARRKGPNSGFGEHILCCRVSSVHFKIKSVFCKYSGKSEWDSCTNNWLTNSTRGTADYHTKQN